MPVNPQFLAARAAEARQRHLAHLRAPCWLVLHRPGRASVRTPLVPLTLRHWLALRVAGNRFVCGGAPQLADLFLFLWQLHPQHATALPEREPAIAQLARGRFRFLRLAFAYGSLSAARRHRRLERAVRQCDFSAACAAVQAFLRITEQDAPPPSAGSRLRAGPATPDRCAADNLVDWLMTTYRMTHAEALDLPLAVGHQLYRERLLQQPDGDLEVFAPSDSLL